jgi:hypothetical protein
MAPHRRWLVAAFALASCVHHRAGESAAGACRPVEGRLDASADTRDMSGRYVLTLIATGGARTGRTATGLLTLLPQDSALVAAERASQPLRGATDIALDSVGAVRMGDLATDDPAAPGVGVYEQRAPGTNLPTVVVRLGSGSNARGPQPFDAGHTTLYVRRITRDGFAGGWASSAGSTYPMRRAQGYFCAVRAPS